MKKITTKTTMKITIGLLLLAIMFPPYVVRAGNQYITASGHGFLFALPTDRDGRPGVVNVSLLLVEFAIILAAWGVSYITLRKNQETHDPVDQLTPLPSQTVAPIAQRHTPAPSKGELRPGSRGAMRS